MKKEREENDAESPERQDLGKDKGKTGKTVTRRVVWRTKKTCTLPQSESRLRTETE